MLMSMGYTQKSIYSFSSEGRGQKAHVNIRLTVQSIFCVMKKATFAVSLVRAIGVVGFEGLSPGFVADTMNWFLSSVLG